MAGVERLEQVESLARADFSQEDSIRPQAQRGFQEIPYRDGGHRRLLSARFQAHQVLGLKLNLGGVFNHHDALVWGDKGSERV